MMSMATKSMVSSLSVAFKKATQLTEDKDEAKREHRQNLKTLIDKYFEDVPKGKAEGIRTAKELVEIIKLDLLLMGEATERTDTNNPVDTAQVLRIQQALDFSNPDIQSLMSSVFSALNGANDSMDSAPASVEFAPVINIEGSVVPSEGNDEPTPADDSSTCSADAVDRGRDNESTE